MRVVLFLILKKCRLLLKKAKGTIIEDVDGNQFIDFFSGCGVINVGHSNEFVLNYVKEQQEELVHALDFPTENKMLLIQKNIRQFTKRVTIRL